MKSEQENADEMRPEYDFNKGVINKYARHFAEASKFVLLAPDVAAAFPNAEAVNEALRALMKAAQQSVKPS